jgi:hypothetical protein
MATVAVFIALGGSSYAAFRINGSQIRDRTITGKKLKLHAVGAREVNVTGLNVPHAVEADQASSATFAKTLATLHIHSSGLTPHLRGAATSPSSATLVKLSTGQSQALFTAGPFTFTGSCTDLGGGDYRVSVDVTSSEDGWIGGSGYPANVTPRPAGSSVSLVSVDSTGAEMPSQMGGQVFASPSGSSVALGNETVGVHILGSDCIIASVYAVG